MVKTKFYRTILVVYKVPKFKQHPLIQTSFPVAFIMVLAPNEENIAMCSWVPKPNQQ